MRKGGLVPLAQAGRGVEANAEAVALERLQRAWPLVVGPNLARQTRLLRVRRGSLLVGCWHTEHIRELRAAAQGAWPEIQLRIQHSFRLKLHRIEITPCDPPPPPEPPPPPRSEDPLDELLHLLRQRGNPGWTKPSS